MACANSESHIWRFEFWICMYVTMVRYVTRDHAHIWHCCGICAAVLYVNSESHTSIFEFWIIMYVPMVIYYRCDHGPTSHCHGPISHCHGICASSDIHSYSMWSSHVRMRHVMSCKKESCYVSCHVWKSHVTYERVTDGTFATLHIFHEPFMTHSYMLRIMSCMKESCYIWMSHEWFVADMQRCRCAIRDSFICNMTRHKSYPDTRMYVTCEGVTSCVNK